MRTSALLAFLLLVLALPLLAQSQPKGFLASPPPPDRSIYASLLSSSTRTVIPLNGDWQVSSDDGDSWKRVRVPSCYDDEGELLYKRTFQIPPEMLKKYRWKIVCYGIQYQSTISINGQFVAQHESGMPFTISIPDEAKLSSSNNIQVAVSNQLGYTSTVPGRKLILGDRTYGGIFRDIILVGVPKVCIDDARFTTVGTSNGAEARFSVRVVSSALRGTSFGGGSDSGGVYKTIPSDRGDFDLSIGLRRLGGANDSTAGGEIGHGSVSFPLESKRTANLSLTIPVQNPALWAPGSPNLYEAVVQVRYQGILIDEQALDVGFRTLVARGNQILLNGQPIPVKGVVYQEGIGQFGASLSYEQMRRDMQAIKDMGGNVVRFADGVPHPYLLRLCDELGLMAFVDATIGTPPASLFGDESYVRRSMDRIRSVVEEGGRYTCVSAYGLSALIPDGDKVVAAVRRMRALIDSIDHRPFYFSAQSWANPQLRKLVDFPGITAFDVDPTRLKEIIQRVQKDLRGEKPLVMLAYGKFVHLNNHNGYSDPISIEAQAKYISDVYNVLLETEMAGGIYWSFNDYRTDRPVLTVNNDDQYIATCGLYDLERNLRQGATMLAALYTDQKTPDVLIGDYTPPSTVLFIAIGIISAVIFLLLINSSRRFRENVFRALLRPYNFYADIRDQRILSNVQTTILGLVIAMTFAVIVSSLTYYYRMDEGFDAILSAGITSDGLKSFLDTIIWRPALSVLFFTLFFFLLMLFVASLIRICSAFVRNRIFFTDAYIISVWGALPVLVLIPIAMVLYRLLDVSSAGPAAFLAVVGVMLWMLYRVLRGTAVIYDVRPMKVYGYALGTIVAVLIVVIVASGETNATFNYLREGIGGWYTGR